MTIIEQLARELNRPAEHIENVVRLLDEGNTIPFIARYRKELHGSMDDTALRTLEERLAYLRNLTARKESVKASIAEQEKLTDELAAAIDCFLYSRPEQNRRIFVRRYWHLYAIRDIADAYGMSESKVTSLLFRMRNELRRFLEKEGIML